MLNGFAQSGDKSTGDLQNILKLETTEFNIFMSDAGNKVRLQALVHQNFENWDGNEQIIYFEGGKATNIGTGENDPNLYFNHSKADTMILTSYVKPRSKYDHAIILDSKYTDVYVQVAYMAKHVH